MNVLIQQENKSHSSGQTGQLEKLISLCKPEFGLSETSLGVSWAPWKEV